MNCLESEHYDSVHKAMNVLNELVSNSEKKASSVQIVAEFCSFFVSLSGDYG